MHRGDSANPRSICSKRLPGTLKLTSNAPENNSLEFRRFLLETIIFRGELLVLGRVVLWEIPKNSGPNQPTILVFHSKHLLSWWLSIQAGTNPRNCCHETASGSSFFSLDVGVGEKCPQIATWLGGEETKKTQKAKS